MRIPFPVHVPLWGAAGFALLLFCLQIYQGTSLLFAICAFLFIVIATLAFNVAGGFSSTSGAYVFFYSFLAVILGLILKAFLGEPADSNLLMPQLTIQVYLGGITAMLGAVYISRKLTPRRALLQNLVTEANMQNAVIGCTVTGIALIVIFTVSDRSSGSFLSALAQVNRFLPLAVILGVIHQIRRSGGKSSISLPVLLSGGAMFFQGLMGYSKEGMFTPVACWLIAAASQRYKLTVFQAAAGISTIIFMFVFLVPYAQYGRNTIDPDQTFGDRMATMTQLLSNLGGVRQEYYATTTESYSDSGAYFNTPQGFFDRLQMISPDDAVIEVTERKGAFGYAPLICGFENLVPHIFWPDKPGCFFGNQFAHEIGGLPEDDSTTGISFSPSGEAYHMGRWQCVLLVAPLLWIMLFALFDSVCGDTRLSPWGLLMTAYYSHIAPEGMLDSAIYAMGYVMLGILVAAFAAAYLMPIIGTLVKGPESTVFHRAPRPSRLFRNIAAVRPSRNIAPETGQSLYTD